MANELRFIDFDLTNAVGVTMTATLGSMTSNRAVTVVNLAKVRGGFVGSLPAGLIPDIYGVRYQSSNGAVDAYDEIQTTQTPLEARIERYIDLAEADEIRINNTYRKLRRGTTDVLLEKQRTVNGTTVELRE
jgi:hypothetical protein